MVNYFDFETEITCLASSIYKKENLYKILSLNEDDFFDSKCKIIFRILNQLYRDSIAIDLPNISLKIKDYGSVIDNQFISLLATQNTSFDISQLIDKIKDLSDKRKLDSLSLKIKETNRSADKNSVINNIHSWLKEIEENSINHDTFIGDLLIDKSDFLLRDSDFVKSHLKIFNKKSFGHIFGDLSILAARPGQGKTTFSLQEAIHISQYNYVDFFTLEMPKSQLVLKAVSCMSSVDSRKIRSGDLSDDENKKINDAFLKLKNNKLNIIDKHRGLDEILNKIRRDVIKYGTRLVVIDYLQLIKVSGNQERRLKIAEATRELKSIAVDLNICVILLSQLNRLAEDKVPSLSDLAESGAIEQDADNVYFIYTGKNKEEIEVTSLIIAKARMGKTDFINIYFNKAKNKFEELFYDETYK